MNTLYVDELNLPRFVRGKNVVTLFKLKVY